MSANKAKKELVVSETVARIKDSNGFIITDYQGMTVEKINVLRRELEKVGAIYKVTKNTFSKKAIDQLNIDSAVKGMFTGITGIVFCTDYVAASKVLAKFSKENEIFKIKGGFIENKHFTMAQIKEISMLESKQQLIGKLVYILNQPLTKLVVQLSKPVKDVVCVLSAIEDKKK